MKTKTIRHKILASSLALCVACISIACRVDAIDDGYFGEVDPPTNQVMRYVSGAEPESLDPQIPTGQAEQRILMAFFDGLVEYDPRTMNPIPAIAESWQANADSSAFVFRLRKDARWSNNDPITARDFVYTFRRGVSPELAARNASLAYYIKYARAYNTGSAFLRDKRTGEFLLEKDYAPADTPASPVGASFVTSSGADAAPETEFDRFIRSPARLTVAQDAKTQAKEIKANPKLADAIRDCELVPVRAEDIGVEAIDDHTFRLTLSQSAPYFLGLLAHHFFRLVPQKTIERHGAAWTESQNIITCGAFKLESWKPYDVISGVKDPLYWDAANVRLERIYFYPVEDATTMMNLYKAGEVDAIYNHTVPKAWIDRLRMMKDYQDAPEAAIEYYGINTKKKPMDDVRVRKAFNIAIDKETLARFKVVNKKLTAFSPEGIFPGYPQPKGDEFDPARAKRLLAEAGYANAAGEFDPKKFPVAEVELTYNTAESLKQTAEFVQAQWKQNLGLTVPLKNMEFKTFLPYRSKLEYKGFSRIGWVADYMDPFTFLNLFYTDGADNATGWSDPKYSALLDEANSTLDPQKRYETLARAEAFMLDQQPIIPLMTTATNWIKKPYVKGMYPNAGTLHAWKFVYIEPDPAKWEEGKVMSDE